MVPPTQYPTGPNVLPMMPPTASLAVMRGSKAVFMVESRIRGSKVY